MPDMSRGASGMVSIPAEGSRATIVVPLVDDSTAESAESFSLQLSSPSGATLANTTAAASIADDDGTAGVPLSWVSTCVGPQVSAVVGGVFDVVQSGHAKWTDVFVDVEVSCESGSAGVGGYRTAVEVVSGPGKGSGGGWCVRGGVSPVTETRTAGDPCAAVAAGAGAQAAGAKGAGLSSPRAVSTRVVRLPDSAVGKGHQLRVWVDLDGDGARDAGEKLAFVSADFESQVRTAGGALAFGLAEDFEVKVLRGSDRVGRAGQDVSLRVVAVAPTGRYGYDPVLSRPVPITAPLANVRLGAYVYTGPSGTAKVTCAPTQAGPPGVPAQPACVTDNNGAVKLSYRVEPTAITSGPQQDDLRVYWDRDRDGSFGGGSELHAREPSDTIAIPIAKAVNYVAIGDSYSAGEAGDDPEPGDYIVDENPADEECRRWDLSYPVVFNKFLRGKPESEGGLDLDGRFETFACVGAVTLNVYDSADPDGTSDVEEQYLTDRPSKHAVSDRAVYTKVGRSQEPVLLHAEEENPRWEPRQAVSLDREHHMYGVDMVTITIGGNDAEFAKGLQRCVLVAECDPAPSAARLAQIEDRIAAALTAVKVAAPDATVFILGYPHLTPAVDDCENPKRVKQQTPGPSYKLSFEGLAAHCEADWNERKAVIDKCKALSADGVLRGSLFYVGGFALQAALGGDRTRIDYWEAKAMRAAADALNAKVASAAKSAGAHFVGVIGPSVQGAESFVGHSQCDEEPWLHGFETKEGFHLGVSGVDDESFHPTEAGHVGYARILEAYVRARIEAGDDLSDAGLPLPLVPESEE